MFYFDDLFMQLETNNFEIILSINEGNKFNFGELEVESKLKKIDPEFVKTILPIKKGGIFDRSLLKESVEQLKEIAKSEGYSFIEIDTNLLDGKDSILVPCHCL